jgi:hypothetical protein
MCNCFMTVDQQVQRLTRTISTLGHDIDFSESAGNVIYPKPQSNLKLLQKTWFLIDYPYIMTLFILFTDRVDNLMNFDGFPADTSLKP